MYGYEDGEGNKYDVLTGMKLETEKAGMTCLAHLSAKEIKNRYSENIWNNYFKFAFVRNPFDRAVSAYSFILQKMDHLQKKFGLTRHSSFEEFFEAQLKFKLEAKYLQKDFLTDDAGKIMVDFVGRFENIGRDFKTVCSKLGIRAKLPHANKTQHRYYKKYYNEKTKKIIEQYYAEDLKFFEYKF